MQNTPPSANDSAHSSEDDKPEGIAARFRGYMPVVVDIETGGFNAQTDAMLEISATLLALDSEGRLQPVDCLSYHLKPFEGANVEQAALEFTGIKLDHPLRPAQDEKDALRDLFGHIRKAMKPTGCKRAILVGHNSSFDLGFLNAAVERNALKRNPFHPFSSFDTATLAGLALGQTVLSKACRQAGIEFNNSDAHSAAYDTQKTAELFCYIVNRWLELGGWPPPDGLNEKND